MHPENGVSTEMYGALIVEDDRSWQQILAEILTDAGLAVDLAVNMEEAVACMRSKSHRVAVVDLSLDDRDHHNRDGLRVLDALRYHDPNCQAILLTGFATVELAVSALTEHGALTCLRKETFRRAEFRELVKRALAARRVLLSAPPMGAAAYPPGTTQGNLAGAAGAAAQEEAGLAGTAAARAALVVEDDAGWRGIFVELLTDAGFRVRLCSSVGEALGYLRRERYALAVIDLSLTGPLNYAPAPGSGAAWMEDSAGSDRTAYAGEGYAETSFRLLASTRAGGIPTIVVSGVATPADIERAYSEQGIFAYLQKQVFSRQTFLQTVKDALSVRIDHELDQLTEREREVLDLLAQGLTNKEIAEALVISTNTVKRHLKAIFEKLDIHTRSAAAARAVGGGSPGE
jgi:RNA polymerase sigma factor (sigma-70 family)